ncbi:hypothetical protein ONZ45_g12096 [Pleurotus djamor]|nr:hypothetical protein ONZ45_g12096 [Pleurotus djamor]
MLDEDPPSDLTEISDDDDGDYGQTSKGKGKKAVKSEDADGYRIRHALKVPRATTYTAQALYEQIHNNDIDLNPEYQRDVVWPESKQIGLIDSIFRNFYIPPVIFAVTATEDGAETKTCIDGKQRLTSIHRFMSGQIPHHDRSTKEKLYYKADPSSSKPRRLLPEKYRRLFANKQIVCVEYSDIPASSEREIFQRVQLGMALTPAEKLQVTNSPRAKFIRDILRDYVDGDDVENGKGGLGGDHLEWDRKRGADFRCLAQAVHALVRYPSLNNISPMAHLEKWLGSQEECQEEMAGACVREVFGILREVVLSAKEGKGKGKEKGLGKPLKVSPIEVVVLPLLVRRCWQGSSPKPQTQQAHLSHLVSLIIKMREDVRKEHVDIRMNSRVAKWLVEYIMKLPEGEGFASTSKTTTKTSTRTTRATTSKAPTSSTSKRKRSQEVEDPRARPKPNAISMPTAPSANQAPPVDRFSAIKLAKAKSGMVTPAYTPPQTHTGVLNRPSIALGSGLNQHRPETSTPSQVSPSTNSALFGFGGMGMHSAGAGPAPYDIPGMAGQHTNLYGGPNAPSNLPQNPNQPLYHPSIIMSNGNGNGQSRGGGGYDKPADAGWAGRGGSGRGRG